MARKFLSHIATSQLLKLTLHNIQLKSVVASLLLRTWQPVTWLACATQAPERPRRLTRCYVALVATTNNVVGPGNV